MAFFTKKVYKTTKFSKLLFSNATTFVTMEATPFKGKNGMKKFEKQIIKIVVVLIIVFVFLVNKDYLNSITKPHLISGNALHQSDALNRHSSLQTSNQNDTDLNPPLAQQSQQ